MTTTFYICAAIGWLVTCGVCYSFGYAEGVTDGYRKAIDSKREGEDD